MLILGIESSCDDTSIALLDASDDGLLVVEQKTASQIDIHKKYGGVIPEVAARRHAEVILPVVEEVLQGAKPDVIAVTSGPGLMTGLMVGIEVAKTLSYLWNIPLVGVNHIEGHVRSVLLGPKGEKGKKDIHYPALCLVASGGHTELLLMKSDSHFDLLGKTRDDAAGEAFDKVAKLLHLEYPGGPKISAYATKGNTKAIRFPRPMIDSADYDFSFAGLKTAALYWLRDNKLASKNKVTKIIMSLFSRRVTIEDFCASIEQAIVDVLVTKTARAIKQYQPKTLIIGGGVSNNSKLRDTLEKYIKEHAPDIQYLTPEKVYTMDNAAMIAAAGYTKAKKGEFISWKDIQVDPNWRVYAQ